MNSAKVKELKHALKEWAIAVEALTTGQTIMLLRKGGISEAGFRVKHPLVWLYPTYEHQKPHLLKPQYAGSVSSVESGWHPDTVTITSCAEVTDVLPLNNKNQIEALQPYHIWNEQMIDDRYSWKPQRPLVTLLLRVYRLTRPKTISYQSVYGGCKSWLDLVEPLAIEELVPAIEDRQYQILVREIKALLETRSS